MNFQDSITERLLWNEEPGISKVLHRSSQKSVDFLVWIKWAVEFCFEVYEVFSPGCAYSGTDVESKDLKVTL